MFGIYLDFFLSIQSILFVNWKYPTSLSRDHRSWQSLSMNWFANSQWVKGAQPIYCTKVHLWLSNLWLNRQPLASWLLVAEQSVAKEAASDCMATRPHYKVRTKGGTDSLTHRQPLRHGMGGPGKKTLVSSSNSSFRLLHLSKSCELWINVDKVHGWDAITLEWL